MNYQKVYDQLVEKCKPRGLDKSKHEGYFEIHHIVPRCMGGSDEKGNLVMFTAREHIFAHVCLWKAYPKHLGVVTAAKMMVDTRDGYKHLNSRILAKLKEESSELRKLRLEGAGYGETRHIDLSGKVFGRLTVLNSYSWHQFPNGQRKAKWDCLCQCGNNVSVIVGGLTSGLTKSCGCWHKEQTSKANRKWNISRKTYHVYHNMLQRCYSQDYKTNFKFVEYGIQVCDEWLGDEGLLRFVEDMGERPEGLQLTRLDPLGDFCKENCKWMTKAQASSTIYKFPRATLPVTGKVGVKFDKKRNAYVARIVLNGKEKSKQFKTMEEASEFRDFIEQELKLQ